MRLILFNGCIEAEGSLLAVETGFSGNLNWEKAT